jgi:16S rRNA (guanine527-N7)-methyltransferase
VPAPYRAGVASAAVHNRLVGLSERFELSEGAVGTLARLLDLVAEEPASITSVRDPVRGVDVHVADSLVALDMAAVRAAGRLADVGAGGGFPGLALAIALPEARVALVESVARKCAFLDRATVALELGNVEVVHARAEEWAAGHETHDLVVARALGPLPVVLEYAAPLLCVHGTLVAWKGRRDPAEERDAGAAADTLCMSGPTAVRVEPFPAAGERHLYLSSKVASTPKEFPRRVGMARKRPLGVSGRR